MDGLKKLGISLAIFIGMFIPVYVYLAANSYFNPVTFFEKAVMIALGYFVLGGLQIWLLIIGIAAIIAVCSE